MSKTLLEKELELFVESQEAWKIDHLNAMLCCDVEEAVALGIHVFERLTQAEARLSIDAYRGKITAEFAEEERNKIARWLRDAAIPTAEALQMAIEYCTNNGYMVNRAQDFAAWVERLRDALTADDEFFDDEKLAALRDEAIDSHRQSSLVEMRSIDD